jgi:deoxyribodipyrimidine photo-lyase
MIPISLVLYRNDLRVEDHAPLWAAAHAGRPVVGLYVFERGQYWKTMHYGFAKTSEHRAKFIREAVTDLRAQLAALEVPLLACYGDTAQVLAELQQNNYGVTDVYYSDELGSEEQAVIRAAQAANPQLNWHAFWTKGLFEPGIFADSKQVPDLFTKFRNLVEKRHTVQKPLPIPTLDHPNQGAVFRDMGRAFACPDWATLNLQPPMESPRATFAFKGGSTAGKARLQDYLFGTDSIATYKETRNGMLAPNDASRLSPWIAQGCLSVRTIYAALQYYERTRVQNESTYWLFFELLWREFFLFMHRKYGNRLFQQAGIQQREKPWLTTNSKMQTWRDGTTNSELVDASMHELAETGYTTNRARQNAASFLTQTWKIDWLYGAEWYESLLLDYEPAVNYGNWQYLAGVGNDARQDRWFDVVKQANQYDPNGAYRAHWR